MTLVENNSIPSNIKLSKNDKVNEFMNAFIYHNNDYFVKCISCDIKKAKGGDQNVDIHYETGKWKWGSVGMMNRMIKRGLVTIAKDHNNDCYCLNATAKLVNMILTEIWKKI